jgi:hypothetical protein
MKIKLEGYLDASGKQEKHSDKVLTVGGLLATPFQWMKFDKAWRALLEAESVPKNKNGIRVFHTTDFIARKNKGYEDLTFWTDEKCERLYDGLIKVIQGNILYPVGISVFLEDYRKLIAKYPESNIFFKSAGNFVSVMCFWHCARWADKMNYNDSISYFFDRGDSFRDDIEQAHKFICQNEEDRQFWHFKADGLSFVNKEKFTGVQAADVLAWELSKNIKDRRFHHSNEKLAFSLKIF